MRRKVSALKTPKHRLMPIRTVPEFGVRCLMFRITTMGLPLGSASVFNSLSKKSAQPRLASSIFLQRKFALQEEQPCPPKAKVTRSNRVGCANKINSFLNLAFYPE